MTWPDTQFQRWLTEHHPDACAEGRTRVGDKSFAKWWDTSDNPSDMLWLAYRCGVPARKFAAVAYECACLVKRLDPSTEGARCRDLVYRFLRGEDISRGELLDAANAAAVYVLAAAAAARASAYAAANAANDDAAAAYAYAYDAIYRAATLVGGCGIIRRVIKREGVSRELAVS